LNACGVRIGTGEIYRQVEQVPEVMESLTIAQTWFGDVRVVLFFILRQGIVLDDDLIAGIKLRIH
jgi:acetoacetyl-CoA synthetase